MAQEPIEQAEVQWSICEQSAQDFFTKINLPFEEKAAQTVSFLDTPDHSYFSKGIVFRVLNKKEDKIKSTLKIEIRDSEKVDWQWLSNREHKCEINLYHHKEMLSCSIDYKSDGDELFNEDQVEMIERLTNLNFKSSYIDRLSKFGPLKLQKWKTNANDMIFESVTLPDGSSVMELSFRVSASLRYQFQKSIDLLLEERSIKLCERQSSRTELIFARLAAKK